MLGRLGVPPSAWVWVHASREAKLSSRDWVARQGGWVELDKLAPEQDRLIEAESGELWFKALIELTAEGVYADPGNGGNRDAASRTF